MLFSPIWLTGWLAVGGSFIWALNYLRFYLFVFYMSRTQNPREGCATQRKRDRCSVVETSSRKKRGRPPKSSQSVVARERRAKRGTSLKIEETFTRCVTQSSSTFFHQLVIFLLQQRGVEELTNEEVYCLIKMLRHGVYKARESFYRFKFYLDIPYKTMVGLLTGWRVYLTDAIGKAVYSKIFETNLRRLLTLEIPEGQYAADLNGQSLPVDFEFEEDNISDPVVRVNTLLGMKDRSEGRARKFYLQSFSRVLVETLSLLYQSPDGRSALKQLSLNCEPLNFQPAAIDRDSIKEFAPAEKVEHFLEIARIIQRSSYRIDWNIVFGDQIAEMIQKLDWKIDHWIYFLVTLGHLGPQSEAQYHPSVSMQRMGRFHTHGGIMLLPQWLRHHIVKPVNPGYSLIELDLCSAQLLLASQDWDAPETTRSLLEIIDRKESVWKHIVPEITDKKVKKVIIYSFIFGCDQDSLLFLALRGSKQKVTQETIDSVLASPLLQPLVAGRDRLLSSLHNKIEAGSYTEINQLGLVFKADEYLERVKADHKGMKSEDAVRKVARQLLAHRLQGAEQAIIHPLMLRIQDQARAENLPYSLNCSSYDGLTYEVHPDLVERFEQDCTDWLAQSFPNSRLEFKVLSGT